MIYRVLHWRLDLLPRHLVILQTEYKLLHTLQVILKIKSVVRKRHLLLLLILLPAASLAVLWPPPLFTIQRFLAPETLWVLSWLPTCPVVCFRAVAGSGRRWKDFAQPLSSNAFCPTEPKWRKASAAILSLSFSHHYQPLSSSKIYIDLCTCEEVGWMKIRFEFWPYFFILGALLTFSLWILWSFSDRK